MISADQTGVQAAVASTVPSCRAAPGDARQSEYARGGTLADLAAYDVHHARVTGPREPSTGIKPSWPWWTRS